MGLGDVTLGILILLGLIVYPAFLFFGWLYLVSLGLSVAAVFFGILYILVAFFGGIGWIILVAITITIIFG